VAAFFLESTFLGLWLFGWNKLPRRVVDPVLGDGVPIHPYPRDSWRLKEADSLLPDHDTWTTRPADDSG